MIFNSIQFLIFFPIVTVVHFLLPMKLRNIWLLICSYFFYMCWNVKYTLLLLGITLITYISGRLIDKYRVKGRQILTISLILNFGFLFYFKYFNFLISIVNRIIGFFIKTANDRLELQSILLPVGISFFSFQAAGYVIDVYRNDCRAERNIIDYALFISFFPQLVAGPIEQTKNLIWQIKSRRNFDYDAFRNGVFLIIWGFFLKIVVADRAAIFVDTVYGDYNSFGGWYIIVATIFFAIQIYGDFYGYSLIAMGTAGILGIKLVENFNTPYLSDSVSEFWRRWHISLMSWFKDYLYIPLGGSRVGNFRTQINRMIVFLVSGLWHGAAWHFVIWGGYEGLCEIIGGATTKGRAYFAGKLHITREAFSSRLVKTIITFGFVDFGWLLFRADSLADAERMIKSILYIRNPWILFDGSLLNCGLDRADLVLLLICIAGLIIVDLCKYHGIQIRTMILKQDLWFRYMVIAVSVVFIVVCGIWGAEYEGKSFVYFQF